jgi:hypothetical protein
MQPEDEDVPVHSGPDPRDWERNSLLSMAAGDVRAADAMLELLKGSGPLPAMARAYQEALSLLGAVAAQARETLADEILKAYGVELPEENPELPTEAVGGFRGNGDSPGNRDHL